MRNKQDSIETKISEIRNRLNGVKSKMSAFDKTPQKLLATQELVYTVIKETEGCTSVWTILRTYQGVTTCFFHGIEDSASESWDRPRHKYCKYYPVHPIYNSAMRALNVHTYLVLT